MVCVLEFYDEQEEIWRPHSELTVEVGQDEFTPTAYTSSYVQSFITADTGVLTVYTTRAASAGEYDPIGLPHTEIMMKITFTDPYSDEAENTVYDEFKVIIKDKCTINELTLTESLGVLLQYTTDATSSAY